MIRTEQLGTYTSDSENLLKDTKFMSNLKENLNNKVKFYISKLSKPSQMVRVKTLLRQFIFNSGWTLPLLVFIFILVGFTSTYTFMWFVSAWRADRLKWEYDRYLEVYAGLTSAALVSSALMAVALVAFARRVAVKYYVYLVKGTLGKSLEWFHSKAGVRVMSSLNTSFGMLDETLGSAMSAFVTQFIKLHIVVAIAMYDSHFTAVFVFLVYCLMMRAMTRVGSTIRYLRDITSANQSLVLVTLLGTYRGLLEVRNTPRVTYSVNMFHYGNDLFQNSKQHLGNLVDRWLCARMHGLCLLIPVLVLLNGVCRRLYDWPADSLEGIKLTICLDLTFNIHQLIGAS